MIDFQKNGLRIFQILKKYFSIAYLKGYDF